MGSMLRYFGVQMMFITPSNLRLLYSWVVRLPRGKGQSGILGTSDMKEETQYLRAKFGAALFLFYFRFTLLERLPLLNEFPQSLGEFIPHKILQYSSMVLIILQRDTLMLFCLFLCYWRKVGSEGAIRRVVFWRECACLNPELISHPKNTAVMLAADRFPRLLMSYGFAVREITSHVIKN